MVFNKNKKFSSLTTAIIIILSFSFLPLDDSHTSALKLFSAEPVFAQLSGQTILPYGEEQVPTVPSTSSSSPTMDFSMFMDSFANSIFNGTSTFAGAGTSIVDGVEVSGISLDKSQNQLSVTLSRTATQVEGSNNNITSTDTTTITPSSVSNSSSVSVIAMRIPISTSDILSLAADSSSSSSSLNALDGGIGDSLTTENQLSSFSSDTFNPFSLLSSLQIGSSTLIDVDWSEPQTVTMNLVGSDSRTYQEQQLNSSGASTDFLLVSVIPHTGVSNDTISSTIP